MASTCNVYNMQLQLQPLYDNEYCLDPIQALATENLSRKWLHRTHNVHDLSGVDNMRYRIWVIRNLIALVGYEFAEWFSCMCHMLWYKECIAIYSSS